MSIMAGGKEPTAIKVGTQDVKAVYAGTEKVWPAEQEINLDGITYDPNDLIRIKSLPYGGRSKSYGAKNICTDNQSLWLLFPDDGSWMVSPDRGTTWIINLDKPAGWTDEKVNDCVWDGSRWCAVGDKGLVMFSDDGMKWTLIPELLQLHNSGYASFTCLAPSDTGNSFWVYGSNTRDNLTVNYGPLAVEVFGPDSWRDMPAAKVTPNDTYALRRAVIAAKGSLIGPHSDPVLTAWNNSWNSIHLQTDFDTFFPASGMPNDNTSTPRSPRALEYHRAGDFRGYLWCTDRQGFPTHYETTDGVNWIRYEYPREHYLDQWDLIVAISSCSVGDECLIIGQKSTYDSGSTGNTPRGQTLQFYRWNMKGPIHTGTRETATDWIAGHSIGHAELHGDRVILQTIGADKCTDIYEWRRA